jgi:hypothetical protein
VLTAIACIRRADAVLGTDHSEFAAREIRGFQGKLLDERRLVPYAGNPYTGEALCTSRGCGNSYVSLFAPEIWPEQAARWYALYEQYFWQERRGVAGFREFPSDLPGFEWYVDVDAGPVLMGFGVAASAFGVGAARTNGRFDHAYPLTAEMLAASWPLPDGTLAGPRILSNATDAPYLGEAAILFLLTRQPNASVQVATSGAVPPVVPIALTVMAGFGLLLTAAAVLRLRRYRRAREELRMPVPWLQAAIWAALLLAAAGCLLLSRPAWALPALLAAQLLPRLRRLEGKTA